LGNDPAFFGFCSLVPAVGFGGPASYADVKGESFFYVSYIFICLYRIMQVEPRIGGIEFPKQSVMRLSGVLYSS